MRNIVGSNPLLSVLTFGLELFVFIILVVTIITGFYQPVINHIIFIGAVVLFDRLKYIDYNMLNKGAGKID